MKTNLMLSTAVAAVIAATTSAQAGVYVGAGIGFNKFSGKEKAVHAGNAVTPARNATQTSNLNHTAGKYSALAGYMHEFSNNLLAGVEVELGVNSGSKKKTELAVGKMGKRSIKANDFFGLYGLFGYKVAEKTKLYAKAGLQNTSFKYKTSDNYDTLVANKPNAVDAKKSKRLNGFSFGAGVEQAVNEKFAVRLELMQTNYGKIQTASKTRLANDTANVKHTIKMKSTAVTAALIYKI